MTKLLFSQDESNVSSIKTVNNLVRVPSVFLPATKHPPFQSWGSSLESEREATRKNKVEKPPVI